MAKNKITSAVERILMHFRNAAFKGVASDLNGMTDAEREAFLLNLRTTKPEYVRRLAAQITGNSTESDFKSVAREIMSMSDAEREARVAELRRKHPGYVAMLNAKFGDAIPETPVITFKPNYKTIHKIWEKVAREVESYIMGGAIGTGAYATIKALEGGEEKKINKIYEKRFDKYKCKTIPRDKEINHLRDPKNLEALIPERRLRESSSLQRNFKRPNGIFAPVAIDNIIFLERDIPRTNVEEYIFMDGDTCTSRDSHIKGDVYSTLNNIEPLDEQYKISLLEHK